MPSREQSRFILPTVTLSVKRSSRAGRKVPLDGERVVTRRKAPSLRI